MVLWIIPSVLLTAVTAVLGIRVRLGKNVRAAKIFSAVSVACGLLGAAAVYFICKAKIGQTAPFEDFSAFAALCSFGTVTAAAVCALCALLSKKLYIMRQIFLAAFRLLILVCTCLFMLLTEEGKGNLQIYVLLFGTFCSAVFTFFK